MSQDTSILSAEDQQLVEQTLSPAIAGIGIVGFEGVPASIIPLPRLRIVQPTSKETELATGGEATPGTFFANDLQEAKSELNVAIIAAQVKPVTFDDMKTGLPVTKDRLNMVLYDLDEQRVCLMALSATSFNAFGQLIAQSKKQGWAHSWDKYVTITSTKIESDQGKYYVANFQIGEELTAEDLTTVTGAFMEFGQYLNQTPETDA